MSPYDLENWARTVWMEARGEGHEGMRAVAHVIYNRFKMHQAWFSSSTITGVVWRPEQFSCWASNDHNRYMAAILADDDGDLNLARAIVDAVVAGDPDPTLDASHYHSDKMPFPPNWAQGGVFTVQIGNHRFYRDVA